MALAIGIDLGTTYSCVAVFKDENVKIIANENDKRTTPSYVAFTDTVRLIGTNAKNQVAMNPSNTVFDVKRLIGRRYTDLSVQADMKHWPFHLVNDEGKPKIEVEYKGETKRFFPEEISSMVLTKMKETAEAYLGNTVTNAVISVPAYFDEAQRQATINAGAIAGLKVLGIINEPTAAAIAYGLDNKTNGKKNILIFDLGGGTFDVSVLTLEDGEFNIKSTAGDTHFGGEEFDNLLAKYFVQEFKKTYRKDPSSNKRALRRLRTACERAKRELSSSTCTEASIEIDSLFEGIDFHSTISLEKFLELCSPLFKKITTTVRKAIYEAKLKNSPIDEILLVGGSTRIPQVQKLLQDFVNGKELNKSINPDFTVAYGAAVQAAILSGDKSDKLKNINRVHDVLAVSIGYSSIGDMTFLIKRNTKIPTVEFKEWIDYKNEQYLEIKLYQGEHRIAIENNQLAILTLNIPPVNDSAKLEMYFSVDANGILSLVSANIKSERQSLSFNQIVNVTTNRTNVFSNEVIEMLSHNLELYSDKEYEKQRDLSRSNLDSYILQVKLFIQDKKDELSKKDHHNITNKSKEALIWFHANRKAIKYEYKQQFKELEAVCNPIMIKFSKEAGADGAGGMPVGMRDMSGGFSGAGAGGPGSASTSDDSKALSKKKTKE